jgi:cation transport ATPase
MTGTLTRHTATRPPAGGTGETALRGARDRWRGDATSSGQPTGDGGAPAPGARPGPGRARAEFASTATYGLLALAAAGTLAGLAARWLLHRPEVASGVWLATLVLGGAPLVGQSLWALRRGRLASDFVAALAILVALAQGQYLAGAVIVVMLATGQALGDWVTGR